MLTSHARWTARSMAPGNVQSVASAMPTRSNPSSFALRRSLSMPPAVVFPLDPNTLATAFNQRSCGEGLFAYIETLHLCLTHRSGSYAEISRQ